MKTDKEVNKNGEGSSRSSYSELPENEESSSSKSTPKKEAKKSSKGNREIRILRRGKTLKDKNDPDRFSGEGINFKAKIIGTEHVYDARGNRMCQGALQRLKLAVKVLGDHKQRIILNISYNGIIIKDEKTGEILHHHPIHKISFISQDTVDKRSFGYVFGCPQTGHEFFGIKTEKIASQVVLTLRDLFLAALELKKKEIENAKEAQKESESIFENGHDKAASNGKLDSSVKSEVLNGAHSLSKKNLHDELLYSNTVLLPDEGEVQNGEDNSHPAESAIDSLLDLQFTMDNLQMGISQMDQSIATAASQGFGFSFSEDDISETTSTSHPMAIHFKDKFSSLYQETLSVSSRSSSTSDYNVGFSENKFLDDADSLKKNFSISSETSECAASIFPADCSTVSQNECSSNLERTISPPPSSSLDGKPLSHNASVISAALSEIKKSPIEDRYAVFHDIDALPSIFDNPIIQSSPFKEEPVICNNSPEDSVKESSEECEIKTSTPVVFAELDPLGNQPFVDKRDFFQDIKNPPKKILKDLVGSEVFLSSDGTYGSTENIKIPADNSADLFQTSSENSNNFDNTSNQKFVNPFAADSFSALLQTPPRLPPKRTLNSSVPVSHASGDFSDPGLSNEDSKWEVKNPFNPFVDDDFPDIPPPNSPPPPPPPRLPTKAFEIPPVMSPPPPRPPSRSNGIPTPPLPKRKPQLSSTGNTWFSFDQEALNFPLAHSIPSSDTVVDPNLPPLPSPARKLPPPITESPTLKNGSATSSPALLRRMATQDAIVTNSQTVEYDLKLPQNNSPRKILSRHSSIVQESSGFTNFFPETRLFIESSILEEEKTLDSPPLPPKPLSIARPRPSPSKKMLSSVNSSSHSSSYVSAIESSNGTHSSSSLVFSSSDDGKMGSSAEAIFNKSSESYTDVFSQNNLETSNEQSSTSETAKEYCEISPDSIFHRKSDPFADDFFMSLPKKSVKQNGTDNVQNNTNSNGVDLHFESLEANT